MAKHNWQPKDWIIYHNDSEHGRAIECCAVGSQEAAHAKGTVLVGGGYYGIYPDVKQLVEDLNSKTGQRFLKNRHYVRKEKQK